MNSFYRLHPAYRYGKDTPWGGDALQRVFGKPIPDPHTGESLEASTLAGLESRTDDGRTLTEVAGGPLPLLLKFIDARESLSVQVHPDDAYAAQHEGGKAGKSEAWVILDAKPGAQIVYGLMPGTDVCALSGREIEDHLRWIDVVPGDVLMIPAGMVHAIGAGILLYEIQQTSDVTYRFWDWDRRDAAGQARTLHWHQACDVARVDLQPGPIHGEQSGGIIRYIRNAHFSLDRVQVRGEMPLPARSGFQYLTVLGDGQIADAYNALPLHAGDTLYLPPNAQGIILTGSLDLLISAEGGV